MYQEPIFLKPDYQERIWGGNKLSSLFGYDIPHRRIGEAWVISAHPNGPSKVKNGPLKGKSLLEAWRKHPDIFNKSHSDKDFPLLIKILDANDHLSVQVHPDDEYANRVEGERYGKTECWYVLDCEPNAEIIFGHHAKTKEEFRRKVESNDWGNLLKRIKVNKGDFFYVPSGTIHGIGEGIVILETQQSSDITYRVYDYDRVDSNGDSRELHIEEAIDVTQFPNDINTPTFYEIEKEGLTQTRLVKEKYFTVYHWKLQGSVSTPLRADYLLVSVIDGKGIISVDEKLFSIKKGDHFILPATITEYDLSGNVEFIVSHE